MRGTTEFTDHTELGKGIQQKVTKVTKRGNRREDLIQNHAISFPLAVLR